MSSAAQKVKSCISLKGSAEIICEYLDYGVNSILFQRGIYPSEEFKTTENYGVTILMSQNKKIKEFLANTLKQLKDWLMEQTVRKVSLTITNVRTLEVLERWDFNIELENTDKECESSKPLKQITQEIRDVMRQITSSISYLPVLDCICSFDILIYTNDDVNLPPEWADTEPANIKNAQCVRLKSFSTDIHRLETVVTYKRDD